MTSELPGIEAVIFDMDGLVLDTEATYFSAWQRAAVQMGYMLSDDFCASLTGVHFQRVCEIIAQYCGKAFELDRFILLSGELWRDHVSQQGIPVKTGFFSLLKVIETYHLPYCLATNSMQVNALECLEMAGLDAVFKKIITRDQVVNAKPAPDIFFRAAEYLSVAVGRCLILEDSLAGIKAAAQAGGISIYIPSQSLKDARAEFLANFTVPDLGVVAQMMVDKFTHESFDRL